MKNIAKKLFALGITATLMLGCITACNANAKVNVKVNGSEVLNTEISTGSWKIEELNNVGPEHKKYFEEAISQLDGYNGEPVALLGTQLVSGTNYAFLCKSTIKANNAMNSLMITYIYVDLSGKATFLKDESVVLPGTESDNGNVTGGWSYAESTEVTDKVKEVMEKTGATKDGKYFLPIAYVGSQVVAGTNHAILCKAAASSADLSTDKATLELVYVYEDLQGNCEIINTESIKLSVG